MRLKLSLRIPLEVWRSPHFSIFKDNIKIGLWYIPPYHTTCKLLERWAAWRVNTDERISKQSFQAESTYIFLRIFFSRKITVYYKILSEATTRKFRKFLGNVTSWRSAMILKKRPRLRAFFYDFVKQFHSSNS